LVGTEIEDKTGRIKKKISGGDDGAKWVSKGRYEFMKQHKIDLQPNQRVFFQDGDCHNFAKENLTYVTFSGKHYARARAGIWWKPKENQRTTFEILPWKGAKKKVAV
jgi:hypothetical protein